LAPFKVSRHRLIVDGEVGIAVQEEEPLIELMFGQLEGAGCVERRLSLDPSMNSGS
jgi:hypothetical protein